MKRTFIALLVLAGLAACSQLNHLDRAQQYFNEGALLDNRLKLGLLDPRRSEILGTLGPEADPLVTLSPEFYYNLAHKELGQALEKKDKLARDGVLGNTYTLKALCEWKLRNYDQARTSALLAKSQFETMDLSFPRDEALMSALDDLISIDEANAARSDLSASIDNWLERPTPDSLEGKQLYQELLSLYFTKIDGASPQSISSAIRHLDEVRQEADSRGDIQLYLLQSQLAGLKTWTSTLRDADRLIRTLNFRGAEAAWREVAENKYLQTRDSYLDQLEQLLPAGEQQLLSFWRRILN